jgi:hypothetical protein
MTRCVRTDDDLGGSAGLIVNPPGQHARTLPARMRARRLAVTVALSFATAALLAGCASTPPPTSEVAAAEAAILTARSARAHDFAPLELNAAEEKRAGARAAMDGRKYEDARRLAAQAEADATLAHAKSRAAEARATVDRKTRENAELRRELLGNGGGR